MGINSSPVSRSLDKKTRIMGFEVLDLLLILTFTGTMKVIFTGSGLETYFVWIPSILIASILRLLKRGKPDNYIKHLGQFHFQPRLYSAFKDPSEWESPPGLNQ